ncbi:EAL domain-containing protein [Beijerinckia indica]|nr:EAL domain-containing protein [Beijerinckia indica]
MIDDRTLAEDLRKTLQTGGFVLHYQPIFAVETGEIVSVEALFRWTHRDYGEIAPDRAIALTEACDLIIPLGEWVLRRACDEARQWPFLDLCVNVSPLQLRHKGFLASLDRIVAETGFDPSRLVLEVTENHPLHYDAATLRLLAQLRQRGIRLALDDFGSGHASFDTLRDFPFDKLKIDRSFIASSLTSLEDRLMLQAIVRAGVTCGLIVTAEGVETKEQNALLQRLGCDELQGFLFSPAVPPVDLMALLNRQKSASQKRNLSGIDPMHWRNFNSAETRRPQPGFPPA